MKYANEIGVCVGVCDKIQCSLRTFFTNCKVCEKVNRSFS